MREGGLRAPTRHPIPWRDADFTDAGKLDIELRRVFDICHGCRRCFNLCDSFPRLFDLIDGAPSGELDTVDSAGFKPVIDACTLCDMCFMTKCPYVPPHDFDLDFPHLMLRARSAAAKKDGIGFAERQLTKTDRNGRLMSRMAGLANWAAARGNHLTRPLLQAVAHIHRDAELPKYHRKTLLGGADPAPEIDRSAPAYGRKAVLYATCFTNFNEPGIGLAARAVLARNGVETEIVYPRCCGMPQFEQGDIESVSQAAAEVAAALSPWIEKGYDIIALTPSCALMLKFEWKLIAPEDESVSRLADATFDLSEYIVDIAGKEGLAEGLKPLEGGVAVHIACHARAQNIGQKAAEMLRLIPDTDITVIERCSGHGGSWGIMKQHFPTALKIGKPVARKAAKSASRYLASECPLAGMHIRQGIEALGEGATMPPPSLNPIELLARAYGIED